MPVEAFGRAQGDLIVIINWNGFSGRQGEWREMTRTCAAGMQDLAAPLDGAMIPCKKHKTSATYGTVGKYMFPGTASAMR